MLITAVKRLNLHQLYVPSGLISKYLRYTYPVKNNLKLFTEELSKKLACAVHVGLLLKHGEDAYYLPTLRQSANDLKSAYMEFWEIYYKVIVNLIKFQPLYVLIAIRIISTCFLVYKVCTHITKPEAK